MLPTRDQIERTAYDRWLRRHRAHGHDRDDWIGSENELTYLLNYKTVVEYPLDSSSPTLIGGPGRCRFCERTSSRATFSLARPVVQGPAERSLLSTEICDECQADCRDPLAVHCENFWNTIHAGEDAHQVVRWRDVDSLAVFKSLVTSAIIDHARGRAGLLRRYSRMGEQPGPRVRRQPFRWYLFSHLPCSVSGERSWISLARRIDDLAPFPYMVCVLGLERSRHADVRAHERPRP